MAGAGHDLSRAAIAQLQHFLSELMVNAAVTAKPRARVSQAFGGETGPQPACPRLIPTDSKSTPSDGSR
jgi:hypothetical protein